MIVLCGLGNPGKKYENTRHNIGFLVLDQFAKNLSVDIDLKKFKGLFAEASLAHDKAILLKPQTYMNDSGESVGDMSRYYKVPMDKLIVIHDEIDLPLGTIRLKQGGGHGGHNGIRSIIDCGVPNEFLRIRVGIGRPMAEENSGAVSNHVLGHWSKTEFELLPRIIDGVIRATELYLKNGLKSAQNEIHGIDFSA